MTRLLGLLFASLLALAACAPATTSTMGPSSSGFRPYNLDGQSPSRVRFRMLDGINALREAEGLPPLTLDERLNRAAELHSEDMYRQQRPWHFGHDGSSPVQRVQRVGYDKELVGENIAETYETELEVLAAWMEEPTTRQPIMDPQAEEMGLGWFQEQGGKIWWTLIIGGGPLQTPPVVTPPANTAPPGAPPTVPVGEDELTDPTVEDSAPPASS
jgi:uncharacterized protein YkwD